MLDFMVIALPRSGTTWAANWLTTGSTFCAHDPLWAMHYDAFDSNIPHMAGQRQAGISCTGIWRWPQWVVRHPARKLILHRNINEVRQSMIKAGIPPINREAAKQLLHIEGHHLPWKALFDHDQAAAAWEWLTGGLPFDRERHGELVQHNIQPNQASVVRDTAINRKLGEELRLGIKG